MIIRSQNKKKKKKRRSTAGFTISELLIAVVIILLVSSTMARGVAVAERNFNRSMMKSEGKVLCSTLAVIVENELANIPAATKIEVSGSKLTGFYSVNYSIEKQSTVNSNFYSVSETNAPEEYGQLMVGNNVGGMIVGKRLLTDSSYGEGAKKLAVKCDITYHTEDDGYFTVTLTAISVRTNDQVAEKTFDVLPLNKLKVK